MGRYGKMGSQQYYRRLYRNNLNFNLSQLEDILLNLFTWRNLPDGIPSMYVEKVLNKTGAIGFYRNDVGLIECGEVNILKTGRYETPIEVLIFNDIDRVVKKQGEFEIIYNNIRRLNSYTELDYFAEKLGRIDLAIDENIDQQKFSQYIKCAESQVASVEAMFQQKMEGRPVIIGDKSSATGVEIEVLGKDVPFVADKLFELQDKYRNLFLNRCGVDTPTEKKERLITGEVDTTNQLSALLRNNYYQQRFEGVQRVNKMFDCSIIVDYNQAFKKEVQ